MYSLKHVVTNSLHLTLIKIKEDTQYFIPKKGSLETVFSFFMQEKRSLDVKCKILEIAPIPGER